MHPSPQPNILQSTPPPHPHISQNAIRDRAALQRTGSVRSVLLGEGGGLDKRCLYSSWFRMPADRQWTHSALPKTNSCVQPSLPGGREGGGSRRQVSVVGMKGKIPKGAYECVAENVRIKQQSWKERCNCDTEVLLSGLFIFLLIPGISSCIRPAADTEIQVFPQNYLTAAFSPSGY